MKAVIRAGIKWQWLSSVSRDFLGNYWGIAVLIAGVLGSATSCAPHHIVSSPEGTVTSYVENKGVLVYAPRSARAQKVVFDTPDQQLIHKPDTPFRKFFDSHAKDFGNKTKLEYAKTTILADIVNMVRNKEFIRKMIHRVVYEHLDSAIAPSKQLVHPILEARDALNKLKKLLPVLPGGKKSGETSIKSEIMIAAKDAMLKVADAADSACLDVVNLQGCPENHNFLRKTWTAFKSSELENALVNNTYNYENIHEGLRKFSIDLSDILSTAGNQSFVPISQIPSLNGATTLLRKRNANLLVNELYKEFETADYPNMRSAEVTQRMEQFTGRFQSPSVWEQTTIQVGFPAEDGAKMVSPAEDLKKHLTQALLEQRYFQLIIDHAVEKRKNLFFAKSSPVQPLRTAQTRLEKFLKENVGNELVDFAGDGSTSLWAAFLSELNGTRQEKGLFVHPSTSRILSKAEQIKFSALLRTKLAGSLTAKSDLAKTMTTILQDQELQKYLRSTEDKSLTNNDPGSLKQRQKAWVDDLKHTQSIKDAFSRLQNQALALQNAHVAKTAAEKKRNDAEQAYGTSLLDLTARRGIQNVEKFIESKQISHLELEKLEKTLSPDQYSHKITLGTLTDDNRKMLIAQARKINDLKTTVVPCSSVPVDPKCTGTAQIWGAIQVQRGDLQKLLNFRPADQHVTTAVRDSLDKFKGGQDQAGESKKIVQGLSQFQLQFSDVQEKAIALKKELEKLANLWCPSFSCNSDRVEKWATELKKNLTTHSLAALAKKANAANLTAATFVPGTQSPDPTSLFRAVVTTNEALKGEEAALKLTEKTYEAQKKSYLAAEMKDADSLVETLLKEVNDKNRKKEEVDRLGLSHTAQVKARINIFLADARDGVGLDPKKKLEDLLTHAFTIPLARNIAASIGAIATQFAATFRNHQKLIQSDSPLLRAFLESDGIIFNNADFKKQAIDRILPAFVKAWAKKSKLKKDVDGKSKKTEDLKNTPIGRAVTLLKNIVEQPEIAYLFGDDGTTAPVISAFKNELYNAFKHRVFEAVKAEQEADYSYWWLTFFPKAIPLGDQRLEGQSVIEVGFPKSITPEEQYHRWLQDQVGGLGIDREKSTHAREERPYEETFKSYRLKVQAATSVLNDFLIVLNSSELSRKYPRIRGLINRTLAELTDSNNGTIPYQENYENAIRILYQETLREWDSMPPPSFLPRSSKSLNGLSGKSVRAGVKYLATFSSEFLCQNLNELEVTSELLKSENPSSCPPKVDVTHDSKGVKARRHLRERAGNDLAWDHFGIAHILFAVTSAAETQETLPFKIELYANAFFDGSRRFLPVVSAEDAVAERAFLEGDEEMLLQNSRRMSPLNRLERFLRLYNANSEEIKGVSLSEFDQEDSTKNMLAGFNSDIFEYAQALYSYILDGSIINSPRDGNVLSSKIENRITEISGEVNTHEDNLFLKKRDQENVEALLDSLGRERTSLQQNMKTQDTSDVGELAARYSRRILEKNNEISKKETERLSIQSEINRRENQLRERKKDLGVVKLIQQYFQKETERFENTKKKITKWRFQQAKYKLSQLIAMAKDADDRLVSANKYYEATKSNLNNRRIGLEAVSIRLKNLSQSVPTCPEQISDEENKHLKEIAGCTKQIIRNTADATTAVLETLQLPYSQKKVDDATAHQKRVYEALKKEGKRGNKLLNEIDMAINEVESISQAEQLLKSLDSSISKFRITKDSFSLQDTKDHSDLNRFVDLYKNAQKEFYPLITSRGINWKRAVLVQVLSSGSAQLCSSSVLSRKGIQDVKVLEKNPYLAYSSLWCEEMGLQAFREELRSTVVHVFQTTYPGVPNRVRLKRELSDMPGYLRALVYQWVRPFWVAVREEQVIPQVHPASSPLNDRRQKERFHVLLNHFLDGFPGLTLPSRGYLHKNLGYFFLNSESRVNSELVPIKVFGNDHIYDWIDVVTSDQKLMDELSRHLVDNLYKSYWEALGKLSRIERHPVPFPYIKDVNFEEFSHWAKPHVQRGIQIIDMLPASRDDLVAMSINEGGAVAKIAAQAEGAAAYDINKLRMSAEVIDNIQGNWLTNRTESLGQSEESLDGFDATDSQRQRISDAEDLVDRSSLRQKAESFGYGAGGRAKGSIYTRAKSALAYSKRREYLDAAITAGGRGDNFAKWVVRRSDLRSNLASVEDGTLVAAAHSGFPNGDQPFHLLVKIPNQSLQRDWDGKEYVLFNSAYTATKRYNAFKATGWLGLAARGTLGLINPAWWEDVEEDIVGTVYPFKWNVDDYYSQLDMLKKPNNLGGRIYLDETDKVKYSDVRTLIEAESAFIKTTRSAQSGNLSKLMEDVQAEAEKFRGKTDQHLETLRAQQQKNLADQRMLNKRGERIQSFQKKEEESSPESN
ncbi:MAG: hypothetical protein NPIRA03_38030 [Nitrospirales bacterium]|nr:MAG: hypothetical protein NPIRA03_38030 [Nitrospirales bacterium]